METVAFEAVSEIKTLQSGQRKREKQRIRSLKISWDMGKASGKALFLFHEICDSHF